jgi:hypothetical protein
MAVYIRPLFGGIFFTGAFLPQKSVLSPRIESQYKPFQRHVSSYQVKRSPDWFVWAAPTLLRGTLDLFNEDNSLRGENTVVDSNTVRVLSRESEARLIFKYSNISTSVEYRNRCFTTRN